MKTNMVRTTVYIDKELHHALRLKAFETKRSLSELVTQSVKYALAEDSADYDALEKRKHEPVVSFEKVLKDLKAHGKI